MLAGANNLGVALIEIALYYESDIHLIALARRKFATRMEIHQDVCTLGIKTTVESLNFFAFQPERFILRFLRRATPTARLGKRFFPALSCPRNCRAVTIRVR